MIVLASTFRPVTRALKEKLRPDHELRGFNESAPLAAQVEDIDVLILGMFRVTESILAAAPRLRLIHQHGRGVDGVDLPSATRRGVAVVNVPGGNSIAVAEHALALIFFMAKKMYAIKPSIAQGIVGAPAGIELFGKTIGIVGLGSSGTELARRALALGMRVMATRARPGDPQDVKVDFLGGSSDLPDVLRHADFVSLHLPLTDGTTGIIGREQLGQMKSTAYLINVARGPLVNYDALVEALREGIIAGAAFDVFWREPADPGDPILRLENFVMTPHVAGFSDASIEYVCDVIAENVRRLSRGQQLLHVVNPEAEVRRQGEAELRRILQSSTKDAGSLGDSC